MASVAETMVVSAAAEAQANQSFRAFLYAGKREIGVDLASLLAGDGMSKTSHDELIRGVADTLSRMVIDIATEKGPPVACPLALCYTGYKGVIRHAGHPYVAPQATEGTWSSPFSMRWYQAPRRRTLSADPKAAFNELARTTVLQHVGQEKVKDAEVSLYSALQWILTWVRADARYAWFIVTALIGGNTLTLCRPESKSDNVHARTFDFLPWSVYVALTSELAANELGRHIEGSPNVAKLAEDVMEAVMEKAVVNEEDRKTMTLALFEDKGGSASQQLAADCGCWTVHADALISAENKKLGLRSIQRLFVSAEIISRWKMVMRFGPSCLDPHHLRVSSMAPVAPPPPPPPPPKAKAKAKPIREREPPSSPGLPLKKPRSSGVRPPQLPVATVPVKEKEQTTTTTTTTTTTYHHQVPGSNSSSSSAASAAWNAGEVLAASAAWRAGEENAADATRNRAAALAIYAEVDAAVRAQLATPAPPPPPVPVHRTHRPKLPADFARRENDDPEWGFLRLHQNDLIGYIDSCDRAALEAILKCITVRNRLSKELAPVQRAINYDMLYTLHEERKTLPLRDRSELPVRWVKEVEEYVRCFRADPVIYTPYYDGVGLCSTPANFHGQTGATNALAARVVTHQKEEAARSRRNAETAAVRAMQQQLTAHQKTIDGLRAELAAERYQLEQSRLQQQNQQRLALEAAAAAAAAAATQHQHQHQHHHHHQHADQHANELWTLEAGAGPELGLGALDPSSFYHPSRSAPVDFLSLPL